MNGLKIGAVVAAICLFGYILVQYSQDKPAPGYAAVATPAVPAPELIGAPGDWINTNGHALHIYWPNGRKDDHKVYLIDFWEYTCVNCLRTLPYVKDWAARYKNSGLVVIGIHAPEFQFAHDKKNVVAAVQRLNIQYPVVVDSDYKNWNAYHNQTWPMKYLIDAQGNIVFSHAGEGGYADTEQIIREQLEKANPGVKLPPAYGDHMKRIQADGDYFDMTPELYGGSERGNFANAIASSGDDHYTDPSPAAHADGAVTLSGTWHIADEYTQHLGTSASDYVALKYHAANVVAVIKPDPDAGFKVYLQQDGKPLPREAAGTDVRYEPDGRSYLLIDSPREYDLVRNPKFSTHELKMLTASPSFRLYEIDFGAS